MNRKLRIVHLEDVPSDAALINRILKRADLEFEILVVDTKEKYVQALETFSPDIILSDHSLPSFNSQEALLLFKATALNIPFILITAAMSDEFAVDILKKGADDYILKDRLERLPMAIKSALEKYQFEKERQVYYNKLTANENKFRSLIENAGDIVVIFNTDFKATYLSPSVTRVLGYSEKESLQMSLIDILHPDDKEAILLKMAECLAKPGIPIKGKEGRVRHKDGTWRWTEAILTNLLHDPAINGIVDNFRDVTEQKLAEQALKESEEKYRSFFENSMDGILLTEPDGTISAANPAACQLFQMTEAEICQAGRAGIVDSTHPWSKPSRAETEQLGKIKAESTFIRKDGSKFLAEVTSSVFQDASGKQRASIIIRDISVRKMAEAKLKKSEEKYKLLFNNNPLPIWVYDTDTLKFLDINQAAINHYGYSREEYLQLTIMDLRPPEEKAKALKLITEQNLKVLNGPAGSFKHLKKDKTIITVEVFSYPLPNNRRLVVCNDITERDNIVQKYIDSETKLLTAQRLARLGYWELNLNDKSLFWTEQVYNIWEVDPQHFKPTLDKLIETIHPDDKENFIKEQSDASLGLKDLELEYRIILPDNSVKWIYEKGKLVADPKGKPGLFEGTVQDITEQKKAQETLLISEARHRGLVQSQTNYVIRTDLEGRYTYCNEKFLKDFSWIYPDGTVIGKDSMVSIEDYHIQRVQEAGIKSVSNPNQVIQVEIDKPLQNGGTKSTLWDFICLTNIKGEPTEIQCIGIDITDRVKAEKDLKDSNNRYELVSEATSDAIYDWDLKTGTLYWGKGFQTLFGHQLEDMTSDINFWTKHLHPEDREKTTRELEAALSGTDTSWEAEYRFEKIDGSYAYILERGIIIRDADGKEERMAGSMQDITEYRKLQELLNKASQLARIGTYEADLVNKTLYWSDITKEIHEVEPDFSCDFVAAANFYKEGLSRNKINLAIQKAKEENIPFDLELQIVTAKGNERWVRVIGETERRDGKCIRFYGSFQDIDKIKKAEQEVLKALEEKNIILESIGDAFFALDKNWVVTYWNKEAEKLLNCPKPSILNRNLWDVFADSFSPESYKKYHQALDLNEIVHFEDFYAPVNRWLEVSAYPSVNGLSVYFKDITERKISELKLVQLNESLQTYTDELISANKGLEQFSYIVSHNLRAPVANIMGLAGLMSHENYSPEIRAQFSEGLLTNVKRLDSVIKDLNAILQVKKGITERKEYVNLPELLVNIQESIQHLILKGNVQIRTDFEGFTELHTIKSYLHSILFNLITNSIKYCQVNCPPEIEIKTEKQAGKLLIRVKDNGLGIDLTKKGDQVFGLYKRFHNHADGKGMGLFMVKTQMETIGGKISIESEVNKGTVFLLEFKENETN